MGPSRGKRAFLASCEPHQPHWQSTKPPTYRKPVGQ